MIECTEINCLKDYIEYVDSLPKEFSMSRGQGKDKPLLPSALRKDENNMRIFSNASVKSFIDDFKMDSPIYLDYPNIENDVEWMVYAQHFGVPTILLDFSFSHLISLMFAVESAFSTYDDEVEDSSVVWFLNPHRLNLQSINRQEIIPIGDYREIQETAKYPCVVNSRKNNVRIAAQNGLFVIFQNDNDTPLERIAIAEDILKKVILPRGNCRHILSSLYTMGMRFKDMYPELSSVSKDIILKHNVTEYYRMEEMNE